MSAVIAQTVALLDIDHTLLFKDNLNKTLLLALKNKGVTDIYLFTDMLFTVTSIPERLQLVKTLRSKPFKFKVHGVITPSDVLWSYLSKLPEKSLEDLFTAFIINYKGHFNTSEFTPIFQEEIKKINELKDLEMNFKIQYAKPGSSFKVCSKSSDYDSNYKKSMLAKVMIEQLPGYAQYRDPKGFMLELFLHHFRDSFGNIIIADDKKIVIDAIQLVDCSPLSLFPIHVTGKDMGLEEYNDLLKSIPTVHKKSSSLIKLPSFFSKKSKSSSKVEIIDNSLAKKEQKDSKDDKTDTYSKLAETDYDGDISSSDETTEDTHQQTFLSIGSHRIHIDDEDDSQITATL